jgi:hypothetical protein
MELGRIHQIKYWLEYGNTYRKTSCPFGYDEGAWKICINLFPRMNNFLRARNICGCYRMCPCFVYGIEEVTARAEEVVNGRV